MPDVTSVPMAESVALNPGQIQMLQKIATTVDISFLLQFLGSFLFYFIAGYLLYASIFAAIGSACDNETDSQQLQTPLSIIFKPNGNQIIFRGMNDERQREKLKSRTFAHLCIFLFIPIKFSLNDFYLLVSKHLYIFIRSSFIST